MIEMGQKKADRAIEQLYHMKDLISDHFIIDGRKQLPNEPSYCPAIEKLNNPIKWNRYCVAQALKKSFFR